MPPGRRFRLWEFVSPERRWESGGSAAEGDGRFLTEQEERQESFTLDEFFTQVSKEEEVDLPESVHHARVVIEVLREAVGDEAVNKVRDQLPDEWKPLFDAGSSGQMRRTA